MPLMTMGEVVLLNITQYPVDENRNDTSLRQIIDEGADLINSNPNEARKIVNRALKLAEEQGDSVNLSLGWHTMGVLEFYSGSYSESLKYYLKSLRQSEQIPDTTSMSRTHNNIGILMEKSGNYNAAKTYYTTALQLYESVLDRDGMAATLNNLGNLYQGLDSLERAFDYYSKALTIRRELGDSLYLAYCYGNIGNLQIKKNEPDSAEKYYLNSLAIFEKLKDTSSMARAFLNISIANVERKRFRQAEQLLQTGLELALTVSDKALVALFNENFSELYAQTGDFRKAYNWRINYETAHNSYLSQENLRQINEMQIKYESEKKARQIELLKKEQELKELQIIRQSERLRRSRTQNAILMVVVILVVTSGYLLLRSYRMGQKTQLIKEKLRYHEDQMRTIIKTQESERNRFAKDLHDGLGQYLTALKLSIINIQNATKLPEEEHKLRFEKMMNLFNDIYAELRNITFNIMPQVLLQKGLVAATDELVMKLRGAGNIRINLFSFGDHRRLPSDYEIAIYRIIQELINNAIKHSKCDNISITFTEHPTELNIMIETNGKSFDKKCLRNHSGNGWKNIHSRLEMLEGKLEADSSSAGNYNTFIIDIPYNHGT